MPYDDPDFTDPHELVGVELPGNESVTRDMAAAFADEFAQLGFSRAQILALFRHTHYAGAHEAWRLLGEAEVARMIDESMAVWSRFRRAVSEPAREDPERMPLRLFRRRS